MTRPSIRNYTLFLCAFYLLLVFVFHSRLQFTSRSLTANDAQSDYENAPPPFTPAAAGGGKDISQQHILNLNPKLIARDDPENELHDGSSLKKNSTVVEPARRPNIRPATRTHKLRIPPKLPLPDLYQNGENLFEKDRFANCHGPKAEREFEFKSPNEFIKIFSGYWDSRGNDFDNQYGGVKIRLMAAIAGRNYRPSLKCFFTVDGQERVSLITYYEMCENHNRKWGGFVLSCEVPPEIQNQTLCSIRVSLDLELDSDALVTTIPVYSIESQKVRYNFAMCVPPMFGNMQVGKLIEFFEFSFHLGAQHVMIYNFSISGDASKTIQHYVDLGKVTVIPWHLPLVLDKAMWYHGQSIAIQDCLYRHMGMSEFVIFNDIDEFMIPNHQVGDKWRDVIEKSNSDNLCGLKFKSAFFDPKHEMLKPLDPNMAHFPSLVTALNHRSKMLSHVRTKCMVKPQKIFEMGIHHISKPILAELAGLDVPGSDAILHHYRGCLPGFGMNCRDHVQDDSALRFGLTLYEKVVKARSLIKYKETLR